MKIKRVSIIGANSFLAQNLIKYLVTDSMNIELYLYDIQEESYNELDFPYSKVNLMNIEEIRGIVLDVDYVFYFTGKTGTTSGLENYCSFIEINEIALLNFLKVYVEKGSNAILIYPSTRLVYKHNEYELIDENGINELKSIYAITKYAAEKYIELYHNVYGVNYIIFRIGTPWGSILNNEGNYGTFKFFVESAKNNKVITLYGNGNIKKTYTHIINICEIFKYVICSNSDSLVNQVFNVGGVNKTLNEIAKTIAQRYDANIVHIPWPKIDYLVDGGTVLLNSKKLDKIINITYKNIDF